MEFYTSLVLVHSVQLLWEVRVYHNIFKTNCRQNITHTIYFYNSVY